MKCAIRIYKNIIDYWKPTTGCENSNDVPAASQDVYHALETTASSCSTHTTTASSSTEISKATLLLPHSEKATKILLRGEGKKNSLFQKLQYKQSVFPYSPDKGKYHRAT